MSGAVPKGGYSVMAQRKTPIDSLDFFCTPPWSTRALCEHVIFPDCDKASEALAKDWSVWEPAAGEGHMSRVLAEYFHPVFASDVHDYGHPLDAVGSFVGIGADIVRHQADWIVTNPPFNLALEFALTGLDQARRGVALLVRTAWLEGGDRYRTLFEVQPPSTVALFAERVPMVKGRWDPKASTATSYAWVIWRTRNTQEETRLVWIPPGRRQALTHPDDVARFANTRPSS